MAQPLSIRLDAELDARLEKLAKTTGRTKSFYIKQAIEDHLDDLEDLYLARRVVERIESGNEGGAPLGVMERDENDLYAEAAALVGMTTSGFVRAAAKEKARALLEQEQRVTLSNRDFAEVAAAIDHAFEPNEALRRAIETARNTLRRA